MLPFNELIRCANYERHITEGPANFLLQEDQPPPEPIIVELWQAKERGWQRIGPFNWICPECVTRLSKEQDNE